MASAPKRLPFHWLSGWRFYRVILLLVAGLVTLIALFYAEENWRGKHAWETYKREQEAKGVVFDYAKLVPPRVPDDQNFAMTPFFAPYFDFVPGTQQPRDTNVWQRGYRVLLTNEVYGILEKGGWTEGKSLDLIRVANELVATNRSSPSRFATGQTQEAARAILEYLKPVDPILDELRNASHRLYSRFNIDYDWESKFSVLLPHLGPLSHICSRCELRAAAELTLNQTDAAFEDVELMFAVLRSTRSEPFLISQVIRASWLTRSLQPIWEGIARHQWSDPQLAEFTGQLDALNFLDDAIHSLRADESFDDCLFVELRSNPDEVRQVEYLGPPVRDDSAREDLGPFFWVLVPRGWFYFEELNYHRLFADEVDDVMTPKSLDPAAVGRKDGIGINLESNSLGLAVRHHTALSRLLLPAVSSFDFKMARAQTYANLARIACALERYRLAHGQCPETLDALVPQFLAAIPRDVITDQPLNYHRVNDGQYVLYSVGWNKKDDGGVAVKENKQRTEGDWVWKYPAAFKPE